MRRVKNAGKIDTQKDSVPSTHRLLALAVGAGIGLSLNPVARASYFYWDVGTPASAPTVASSGTWQAGSWVGTATIGTAPSPTANPGIGDIAVFNLPGLNIPASTVETVSLAAPQSALGLIFDNNNTSASTVLQSSGSAQSLTVGSSGIVLSVGGNNGAASPVTIGSANATNALPLLLSGSQSWNNSTGSVFTVFNGVTNASATTPATLTVNSYVNTAATSGTTILGIISDNGSGQLGVTAALGNVGTFTLGAANTYTGNTTVQSGILSLDFSQTAAPISNIVSSSSNLVLGGGTAYTLAGAVVNPVLTLKGSSNSGGVDTQTFASTTVKPGLSTVTLTANGASTLTANLGGITRSGAGAVNFNIVPAATGVIATTSNANDATGILADWITVGTASTTYQYATVSSGKIVSYTYTTAQNATAGFADLTSPTVNYNTAAGITATAGSTPTANTLRLSSSGTTTLTNATLTLNGLMQGASGANTVTGGSLAVGTNQELVVSGDSNALTLNTSIIDNAAGPSAVTFATLGTTTLSGASKYTGTTTLDSGNTLANVTDVAGVSGAFGVGGPITFAGGTLQYSVNSVSTDYSARFKNSVAPISIDLESATRTGVTWNGSIDSSNTGGIVIKNSNGGQSTLTINGSNSYTGSTVIDGTIDVVLGNGAAFSTSTVNTNSSVAFSASTDLTGGNALTSSFLNSSVMQFEGLHSMQINGTVGDAPSANSNKALVNNIAVGSLTIAGRLNESGVVNYINNYYFTGIGNTNITGVIANDASGTGGASTFLIYNTGVTTFTAANTYTGATSLYQGTLKLDYSAAGAPLTNILPSVSKLTLAGGNLTLVGAAGVNNVQSEVQGVTINPGSNQINFQPGTGGQVVLTTPTIANIATDVGSYVNVNLSGTSSATNGLVLGSSQASTLDTYGLIRHFFVGSNDFATESASGNVVAYSGYTDQASVSAWAANQNITDTTTGPASGGFTGSLAAPLSIGSLRYDDNDAGSPDLGGNTLSVADGILVTTNVNGKSLTLNNGTLQPTAPAAPNTSATDLIVANNGINTSLTIGATIQNNGAVAAAFTKAGTGLVTLTGPNTYTGITYITSGVLAGADPDSIVATTSGTGSSGNTSLTVTSSSGLSTGQAVFGPNIPAGTTITNINGTTITLSAAPTGSVSGAVSFGTVTLGGIGQGPLQLDGGVLGLTTNFTRAFGAGPGQFVVNSTSTGFAAMTAAGVTVNLGGASPALALAWGTGLGGLSGGNWGPNGYGATMILGASTDQGMLTFANPIDFGNTSRNIEVDHGSTTTFDAQFSGVLSAASNVSGFIKTGSGSLWLNNAETYTGPTVILAGTVSENSTGTLADTSALTIDGTTAVFDLGPTHNDTVGTVTLDGGGQITGAGSVLTAPFFDFRNGSVSANLAGSGAVLAKSTAGTVTLSASNAYTGATTVTGGSLVLAAAGALPLGTNLTIGTGASVVANNLGTATGLAVGTLSVAGKLDLNNNALVVHSSTIKAVTALVASGFNGSGGIVSSTALADTTHLTTLGTILNTSDGTNPLYGSFEGVNSLAATDVLVKYTYFGDANLDGKVDASDYSLIDSGFLTGATGWYNGDFNYDGVINGSDYTLIDNAFNNQGAQFTAQLANATAQIGGSAVPEPTTLGVLAIGSFGLLGRRRKAR